MQRPSPNPNGNVPVRVCSDGYFKVKPGGPPQDPSEEAKHQFVKVKDFHTRIKPFALARGHGR
jgi:hypothetical protein